MDYLHNFTITVLVVAVTCFICEVLTVEGTLGKYTALVMGLVISFVIVNAVFQIKDVVFATPDFQAEDSELPPFTQEEVVAEQFEVELKAAVETAVFKQFGEAVVVWVSADCADGVITIKQVTVENEKMDENALKTFVETQFGLTPVMT